jgi:tRNA threonylcarbamoyladenosine biosynthesis protein TsaE
MEFITKSARETQDIGQEVSNNLTKETPIVIALSGDLGSGKTTFVQGFVKGLGIKKKVISPTFIIMRTYKANKGKTLYHLDLYRIDRNFEEEIENLGITDLWKEKDNVLIIEWAEKIKDLLPKNTIWVYFKYLSDDQRKIIIEE